MIKKRERAVFLGNRLKVSRNLMIRKNKKKNSCRRSILPGILWKLSLSQSDWSHHIRQYCQFLNKWSESQTVAEVEQHPGRIADQFLKPSDGPLLLFFNSNELKIRLHGRYYMMRKCGCGKMYKYVQFRNRKIKIQRKERIDGIDAKFNFSSNFFFFFQIFKLQKYFVALNYFVYNTRIVIRC